VERASIYRHLLYILTFQCRKEEMHKIYCIRAFLRSDFYTIMHIRNRCDSYETAKITRDEKAFSRTRVRFLEKVRIARYDFTNCMTYTVSYELKVYSFFQLFHSTLLYLRRSRYYEQWTRSQIDCEAGLITRVNPIFRRQPSMTLFNLFLSCLFASLFTCSLRISFQYITYFITWLKRRVAREILILLLIKDFAWIKSPYFFLVFSFCLLKSIFLFFIIFYKYYKI